MKVIKVTKEYFQTEDEKVYFFEPLEKEISVEDMQKIVDANQDITVQEVEERRKLRLKMNQSNLMEFEKEEIE